jgi:hypothetical protein
MALIKTILEIRNVIPGLSKLSDTAQLPNLDMAEWQYIIPVIGQAFYDDLNTKFNAGAGTGTLTAGEIKLVRMIQLPLAAYALMDQLGSKQATITDSGVRVPETTAMRTAYPWEYTELKNTLTNYACLGTERLLEYLFIHKADWNLWTDSTAYKELNNLLIKSGVDFNKLYRVDYPLRTFWLLKPVMEDVEEWYLVTTLGRQLLAWVKAQDPGIIVTEDGQEVDIKKMLKKATAHLVIKHASEQLRVKFSQYGFTVLSTDPQNKEAADKRAADNADLFKKVEAAQREGQNYLAKAASYFKRSRAGDFAEDFGTDFYTAFDSGPLAVVDPAAPTDKGNGNRSGVFRMT